MTHTPRTTPAAILLAIKDLRLLPGDSRRVISASPTIRPERHRSVIRWTTLSTAGSIHCAHASAP